MDVVARYGSPVLGFVRPSRPVEPPVRLNVEGFDTEHMTMRKILDELRLIREILERPPKSLTEKRMRQMVRGALKKGKGKRA